MESEDSSGATGTDNTGAMVAPPRPLRGPILYSDSQSQSISHLHEQDSVGEEEDGEDADDEGPSSATQRPRARRLPSFLKHWFFAGGYQWDWALVVALFLTSAIPQRLVLPVDRHITPADPALSYPYTQGTVSSEVLYACVIMGPLLLFSLAQVWVRSSEDW